MSTTVTEKQESRRLTTGDNPSIELVYTIEGTASESSARTALLAEAPTLYSGVGGRRSVRVEPVFVDINDDDVCIWEGTVTYGARPSTGDNVFSFDTGGGTEHVTQSKATLGRYVPNGEPSAPTAIGGIIGWNPETGTAEGVDITVPIYNWSEAHYLDDAYVTARYRAALFAVTGHVNQSSFRGFAPGEVLFLGASGALRDDGDWEITFRFAASPNKTDLVVGDPDDETYRITGIHKRGWEYLWIRLGKRSAGDGPHETIEAKAVTAIVEQVYDYGDFSRLGIGTS